MRRTTSFCILELAALLCLAAPAFSQTSSSETGSSAPASRSALEFSPVAPFLRIYELQYARRLDDRQELLFGAAYVNIKYDHGRSHAPTAIVGYRRYLWKGAHVEDQLWLSYNWFLETGEQQYYNGGEVWNEIRPGYTWDFRAGRRTMFVHVQYLIGFGLYGRDSKPQSFKDQAARDGDVFLAPMFFLGWRF